MFQQIKVFTCHCVTTKALGFHHIRLQSCYMLSEVVDYADYAAMFSFII